MILQILELDRKSDTWCVAKLMEAVEGGNTFDDVSINKTDRNSGAVQWPQWDSFAVGVSFEGNVWENPTTGKRSVFPPKPKAVSTSGGAAKGGMIAKAQETKREDIKHAQDTKREDISRAAAFRDATLITVEWIKSAPFPMDDEIKSYWRAWVKFFLNEGEQPF
jgi:hypothetical protein